jgi:hypothetical protein
MARCTKISESQVIYRMDDLAVEIDYAVKCLEESVANKL